MKTLSRRACMVVALTALFVPGCSREPEKREPAEPLRVAVAANFASVLEEIARQFEKEIGHRVEISAGSTGKVFAQIVNGAPYDVFLSADAERPADLERSGKAVPGSRFTYALGRLALYGPGLRHPEDGRIDLREAAFRNLACANPKTAPYGFAAQQVLEKLGLWATLEGRIARGENVTQAHQYVDSGAAELGFVALSSVIGGARHRHWVVPEELHQPIRQDAVQLRREPAHPAAALFLRFLRSPDARDRIRKAGYGAGAA